MPPIIQFSLVDDDEGLRQALRLGLRSLSDFTCVGCYASGAEALAGIPRVPDDVVLMDIRMPTREAWTGVASVSGSPRKRRNARDWRRSAKAMPRWRSRPACSR